ncbi:MAG: CDP-glycerol glycerophosphotransferase family protein [Micropruina sp.]|uniref:CDP-glycerol glycerophosphotransferase family protein n=1 Tax=Micropruina sp. TaxID=2737536 RepID=UPI0039E5BC72
MTALRKDSLLRLHDCLKAVIYLLNLPLFWLTRLTPRRRRRWVFGAWQGRRYADNPRHFAEYVSRADPSVECIWVATSSSAVAEAEIAGLRAVRAYSLAGYWLTATAELAIIANGVDDVNRYVCPPRVVNLWHGAALIKQIGCNSRLLETRDRTPGLLSRIFPFHRGWPAMGYIAGSDMEAEHLRSAFSVERSRIFVTGYPRADILVRQQGRLSSGAPLNILYAPTFRDLDPLLPLTMIRENLRVITEGLKQLNAVLHVRLHPNTLSAAERIHDRIRVNAPPADGPDVNMILCDMDVLITDYSSVFVDFLLTGRPIVFAPFDLSAYRQQERELAAGYGDASLTPGPICDDWEAVIEALALFSQGEDRWEAARRSSLEDLCSRRDGKSCARVLEMVNSLSDRVAEVW